MVKQIFPPFIGMQISVLLLFRKKQNTKNFLLNSVINIRLKLSLLQLITFVLKYFSDEAI